MAYSHVEKLSDVRGSGMHTVVRGPLDVDRLLVDAVSAFRQDVRYAEQILFAAKKASLKRQAWAAKREPVLAPSSGALVGVTATVLVLPAPRPSAGLFTWDDLEALG